MNGRDVIDIRDYGARKFPVSTVLGVAIIVGVLALVLTSAYTISPEERGIILRLGRYVDPPVDPGLHFRLPLGIDKLYRVPVQRQLKETFGFRQSTDRRGESVKTRNAEEALMLTGDLNVAVVEWIVQYRIDDPYKFLFRVRGVQDTFRDMTEAVMRQVIGDRTVNEILTVGRQEIATEVERELQELCVQYETGIHVEQIVLQDVNPPDPVKASFNEVNQAQQEREKLINQARAEYNQAIPKARGEALQMVEQAEGYALDRVNRAAGEAQRFTDLYRAYSKAPDVTRRRIYLETMTAVLPRVKNKVIIDEDLKGLLPMLNIGKEVAR